MGQARTHTHVLAPRAVLALVLASLFLVAPAQGQRTAAQQALYEKVYTNLDFFPCVRLLDRNGVVGCGSPRDGVVAPLAPVNTSAQLDALIKGSRYGTGAVAVVLPMSMMTRGTLDRLRSVGETRVAAVLVLHATLADLPANYSFSVADTYPNKAYSVHASSSYKWNPHGNSLHTISFPFPIVSLPAHSSATVSRLATDNLGQPAFGYPLYSVQIQMFMFAGSNAATCLRRGFCLPLGSFSVWGHHQALDSNKDTVVLSATLDSNALFHQQAVGYNADTSGVVALLAAAQAIAKHGSNDPLPRNLVYTLFNGESWGLMGSTRWTDDVASFKCTQLSADKKSCSKPFRTDLTFQQLRLDRIRHFVELNQLLLGSDSANATLYLHTERDPDSLALSGALRAVGSHMDTSLGVRVNLGNPDADTPGVPPGSYNRILLARQARKVNTSHAGVVLTDHAGPYVNRVYHSQLDNAQAVDELAPARLCQAATLAARSMYMLAHGDTVNTTLIPDTLQADCNFVRELLVCFTQNLSCDIAKKYFNVSGQVTPNMYTSVYANFVQANVALAFGVLNDTLPKEHTHYHEARAPGIDLDENGAWSVSKDTSLPSWTESSWGNDIYVRVFISQGTTQDLITFFAGIIALGCTGVLVRLLALYGKKLV